ncbi:MAG: A/G-specific adenine glycosylase [Castellaniella sp.]|uniref:A/G-specific adenine glycosylase n=1 Tax=Castellaniella sp. TaxID=1955812 RepID=UPI0011FDAB97|nr:A/G-specific adenine glycosylase [Castellaniella sp.]TAN27205.1 MAG: A/G-specific adenine glycosylase [Castellaniella sp.]
MRDPASRIAAWQIRSGRHELPWQATHDPYPIWLSETMLQQTQANTVIPYYRNFLARFPDVRALAGAPLDAVLQAWAGLGYYARARNLHRCAQAVCDVYGGRFPPNAAGLAELPGIGPSTAAAIAAFAYGERAAILDGNVRRVLARHHALEEDPGTSASTRQLWTWAREWLAQSPLDLDMRAYTQGQMDLGATVCTRTNPDCAHCPLADDCMARIQGRQHELPRARARRQQPQQSCHLLIVQRGTNVLLQRRPERGIWGGLWSLPQFETQDQMADFCPKLPSGTPTPEKLAAFDHVFTHFRLHLQPWLLRVPDAPAPATPSGHAWVSVQTLRDRGMPTPVARLLAGLYPDPT